MVEIWDSNSSNNSRNQFTQVNKRCIKQFIKVLAVSWTNRDRQTKTETGTLLKRFVLQGRFVINGSVQGR